MVEKQLTDLGNKIKTLKFRLSKTDEVIAKRDRQALERHKASITTIVEAVDELKDTIEEKKFAKGESEEDIAAWSRGIEEEVERADEITRDIDKYIKAMDLEKQEQQAVEEHKRRLEFEREILEQKAEFQKQEKAAQAEQLKVLKLPSAAKLPKLSIAKFNGKIEKWLPFWGKFVSEIDSTNLASLTKFGYLKELLEKHVRTDIDGLPFTEEGYQNAKAILETEYGQPTEILNAYVKNIMELPVITGTNPRKIKEFYKQLRFNVQSLDTLGRLADVKGNVRSTLDKLKGIKTDLVRGNETWRDWDFKDLLRELKKWIDINPVEENATEKIPINRGISPKQTTPTRVFKTQSQQEPRGGNQCVYRDNDNHKSVNCTVVTGTDERHKMLAEKKLCFNCTGARHHAGECKSKLRCQICRRKHHTSICHKQDHEVDPLLVATGISTARVTYPVVVVEVEGIKCRALLDTGAGTTLFPGSLIFPPPGAREEETLVWSGHVFTEQKNSSGTSRLFARFLR